MRRSPKQRRGGRPRERTAIELGYRAANVCTVRVLYAISWLALGLLGTGASYLSVVSIVRYLSALLALGCEEENSAGRSMPFTFADTRGVTINVV